MTASRLFLPALVLMALSLPLSAHETEEKIPAPGFRLESERATEFAANAETSVIRVYPTIIRTPTDTTFSTESQKQVIAYLNEEKIAKALPDGSIVNPGELKGRGQFQWFQNDSEVIGKAVQNRPISEKYILVMEILFPPAQGDRIMVFGIHCIILDNQGENVFSFLLNSHHQLFIDANLEANDSSEKSREALIRKATEVGMEALALQIQQAANE